ncbi:hypothetical protein Tco_1404635 [Tanacetum coccineum]
MAPTIRTDDQILPHSIWVVVGKSNCYLDVERSQSNPIYKIAVDILKQTNFFRAFIASSTIPSIYIQQFWDTVRYDKTTGNYSCQLDEQWFDLTKDTLRDALQITPVDNNIFFPPTPDALIKFVNDLGYPKVVRTLSDVGLKDQGLRCYKFFGASSIEPILIMQRGCGKNLPNPSTLSSMTKKKLAQHTQGKKKATIIVTPSVRFSKLIIQHLQSKHKFHPRRGSPLHLPNEESILGYLKFSAKGTKREVFGMPIPNDFITDDIRDKRSKAGKVTKKRKPKSPLQLIDEFVNEGVPENEPRLDDEEAATQRTIEESLKEVHNAHRGPLPPVVIREPDSGKFQPLPEVLGKGKKSQLMNKCPAKGKGGGKVLVDEIVTDVVDWAIQALLRDRFRDLPEADMKEILHHRMWESNSYKAYEDHKKLYEALEQSMAHDHTDSTN